MVDVSVIIVNYNGGEWIERAIRAVLNTASGIECEIIVADNGSKDGSAQRIEDIFGERIRVIRTGENKGFAAGNNAALTYCSGRNILFLNPDTEVRPGAIKLMSEYLDTHNRVGACGGNLFNDTGKPAFSYWMVLPGLRFEINRLFSDIFLRLRYHGSEEHNYTKQELKVAHIIGADLMVKRAVLDEVGKMDEDFFLFYEETELCYRIQKAGYSIMSIPQAEIIHYEGQTIDKMQLRLPNMMNSRRIYLTKCCPAKEHMLADIVLSFSCSIRIMWFSLRRNKQKVKHWQFIKTHIKA